MSTKPDIFTTIRQRLNYASSVLSEARISAINDETLDPEVIGEAEECVDSIHNLLDELAKCDGYQTS